MNMLTRLDEWKQQGSLSEAQHARLLGLVREQPFSLFLELNVLLYLGVLAFIGGLGWTVTTWSKQLGDVVIVGVLSLLLAGCFWFCFSRVAPWTRAQASAASPVLDYVLYLGSLVWCVELAYLETRFHLLSGQWSLYLLATALLFFLLAYRFDNRFVLSLALSSLAGWFGLTISLWPWAQPSTYRQYAILYSMLVGVAGVALKRLRLKPHFFTTYLNLAAIVLLAALLSGVFEQHGFGLWICLLLAGCGASLAWGLRQRQFAFVVYAALYGYVGVSDLLLRHVTEETAVLLYFAVTATAMIALLVLVTRRFGRSA